MFATKADSVGLAVVDSAVGVVGCGLWEEVGGRENVIRLSGLVGDRCPDWQSVSGGWGALLHVEPTAIVIVFTEVAVLML